MTRRHGLFIAFVAAFVAAMAAPSLGFGVGYNYTPSMPQGLYAYAPIDQVSTGTLVLSCMPTGELEALAKSRHYFQAATSDRCASGLPPLLKRVAAVPGDSVLIDKSGVTINGAHVETSEPAKTDSLGRPMPAVQPVAKILKPGEYVLVAPYPKSLDSRYYGPVTRSEILSAASPLLLF